MSGKYTVRPMDPSWDIGISHYSTAVFWMCLATLQGTNISHLGKRKIIFKRAFLGGYVSFQDNNPNTTVGSFPRCASDRNKNHLQKFMNSWPQNCDRLSAPFLATSIHQPVTAPVSLDFGKKTTVDSEFLHVFLL